MNNFQLLIVIFSIFTCALVVLFSTISYIVGKETGKQTKREEFYNSVIKEILGEMYIDECGNNVLNGGTEDYERKWKYEIGCNYGLQKSIKIMKSHISDNQ